MTQQQTPILRPETLVKEFEKNGVTHIITIPDSETNYLYELMLKQQWLDIIPVSREGESWSNSPRPQRRWQDAHSRAETIRDLRQELGIA